MTRGYIRVEIPPSCLDCQFFVEGDCKANRPSQEVPFMTNVRPEWCPIKEHDLMECAERLKLEMETLHAEATKRLGW